MVPIEIKLARMRLGLTQQNMAEELGISVVTYSKKETGKVRFTDREKILVARKLNQNLGQFNEYFYNGELTAGVIGAQE